MKKEEKSIPLSTGGELLIAGSGGEEKRVMRALRESVVTLLNGTHSLSSILKYTCDSLTQLNIRISGVICLNPRDQNTYCFAKGWNTAVCIL